MDSRRAPDPWFIELIVVEGRTDGAGRRALSRDVARGLLLRLRRGAYVERLGFEAMTLEQQHVVRARALAAVSQRAIVFSHHTAAVVHGLPVLSARFDRLHTTVSATSEGGQEGVVAHRFDLPEAAVVQVGPLRVTAPSRTVVDVAGAGPFDEGVMIADAALFRGLSRPLLEAAAEAVGPRRAANRIAGVIAFAHPGGESAAESRSR